MSEAVQNSPRASSEFLGMVAYACLAAFEQTARAAAMAPRMSDKLLLGRIASQRFSHVSGIEARLADDGTGLDEAGAPFEAPLLAFETNTAAHSLAEAVVRLCVLGGLAADFAEGVRGTLPSDLQALLDGAIDDGELADEPGRMLRQLLDDDPSQAGVLAMYARRLLGEAFSQAQRVAAAHPGLTTVVTGCDEGDDLAAIGDLMAQLASRHAERLAELGLA